MGGAKVTLEGGEEGGRGVAISSSGPALPLKLQSLEQTYT